MTKDEAAAGPLGDWRRWIVLIWLVFCAWKLWDYRAAIHWFALPDTDDHIRLMQVRALLHGQGWYDLRQYRLNPPHGFDIHWSRLVDLPIAGLILLFRPLVGGADAEKVAVAVAPLIPLLPAFIGAGLTARRLVAPYAWILAAAVLMCCQVALFMFAPLRIDHHGWQLAFLMLTIAGLADPDRGRGGVTVGVASALSLVIGLEMLPYIAVAGASLALRWVWTAEAAPRLRSYAVSLAGAAAIGYVIFASYANRAPVCDALSPVWLSTLLVSAALLVLLSMARVRSLPLRLLLCAVAGGIAIAFFVLAWPDCLGRPEHVSPELERLWLANVREARPIYMQDETTILGTLTLPVIGLIGTIFAIWRARRSETLHFWFSVLVLSLFSTGMLFWQMRAGPAAQFIAVIGATAIGWALLRWIASSRLMLVRVFGAVAAFLIVSGLASYAAFPFLPKEKKTARSEAIDHANRYCPTLPSLHPIALLPKATIMTFVDLGPRLITVTHHDAIAGPYHRNGAAILDIHHAFDGPPDQAHAIARKHRATLLLICPNMNESTIYQARSPHGFYAQLAAGKNFGWLEPIPLPKDSPFKLWRIK